MHRYTTTWPSLPLQFWWTYSLGDNKKTKTETVPDKNWEDDEDEYNRSLMVMVMTYDHDGDDVANGDHDGDDVANGDCIWKLWETIEQNLLALSYKVQHKLILRSCFDHKMDYHDL